MTDDYSDLIARLDDVADALECFGEDKHPADIRKEAARDIRDALDALTRLSQQVAKLEAENFALAAGQCIHDDGLSSDDGGTQYCKKQQRIAALESELAARESAEPIGESAFDPELGTFWEIHASAENFAVGTKVFAHPPAAAAISLIDERQPDGSLIVSAMQGDEEVARMCLPAAAASEALLREVAALKRYDPNAARGFSSKHCVLNPTHELMERIDAAIAAEKESKT